MAGIEGQLTREQPRPGFDRRFWLAAAAWTVLIGALWGIDLLARISERQQSGIGKDDFRLISEQVTSALAVLVLVLFVVRWLRLFPLRRDSWVPAIIGHTAGSMLFALGHHVLMILLRLPWYAANGIEYQWREPFLPNLVTEYQKDIKIYFGMILVLTAWNLYRRLQARALAPPLDRMLVQTGTAQRVLELAEIECLEAARNYVSVHAGGREYIVRDSISALLRRLPQQRFVRTHRSHIVNLVKVREIRTTDSRQQVVMESGRLVPLGRSYRDAFRAVVSGKPIAGQDSL
jgi:hypothetical protein